MPPPPPPPPSPLKNWTLHGMSETSKLLLRWIAWMEVLGVHVHVHVYVKIQEQIIKLFIALELKH